MEVASVDDFIHKYRSPRFKAINAAMENVLKIVDVSNGGQAREEVLADGGQSWSDMMERAITDVKLLGELMADIESMLRKGK